jgi:hypothetical protein
MASPLSKLLCTRHWLVISCWLLLWLLCNNVSADLEAKWTPADNKGPLALSQNQRNQLLQLEQTILTSPNPEATLEQVAASQQMEAVELWQLLQQNRQELERAGVLTSSRSSNNSRLGLVLQLVATLITSIRRTIQRHPRACVTLVLLVSLSWQVYQSHSSTGLVLAPWLTRGRHVTLCLPPRAYLQQTLQQQEYDENVSLPASTKVWDRLVEQLPASTSYWIHDTEDLPQHVLQAHSAQFAISWSDLLPADTVLTAVDEPEAEDEEEEDDDNEEKEWQTRLRGIVQTQAQAILSRWTALSVGTPPFVSWVSGGTPVGLLVVPGLHGRFGLQTLHVVEPQTLPQSGRRLVLSTTADTGAYRNHWNGQLCIEMVESDEELLLVRVHWILVNGPTLSSKAAQNMVTGLLDAVVTTLLQKSQQALARQAQSRDLRRALHGRATRRRQARFHTLAALEAMAADRRRRWQRQNPNAGHYRPSGHRLQSPKNAVY